MDSVNFICSWSNFPTLEGSGQQSQTVQKLLICISSVAPQASTILQSGTLELGWLIAKGLQRAATVSPTANGKTFQKNDVFKGGPTDSYHSFRSLKLFWRIEELQPLYSSFFISVVSCFCQDSYALRLSKLMEKWVEVARTTDIGMSTNSSFITEEDESDMESAFVDVISNLKSLPCNEPKSMLSPENLVWSVWMSWWGAWSPDLSIINQSLWIKEQINSFKLREYEENLSSVLLFSCSEKNEKCGALYHRSEKCSVTAYDFAVKVGKVVARCMSKCHERFVSQRIIDATPSDHLHTYERVAAALWRGLLQPVAHSASLLHGPDIGDLKSISLVSIENQTQHLLLAKKYHFFSSVSVFVYLVGNIAQLLCNGIPLVQKFFPTLPLLKKWVAIRSLLIQIIYSILREKLRSQNNVDLPQLSSYSNFCLDSLHNSRCRLEGKTSRDLMSYEILCELISDVKKKFLDSYSNKHANLLESGEWIELLVKVGHIDDIFCDCSEKLAHREKTIKANNISSAVNLEKIDKEYDLWYLGVGKEWGAFLPSLLSLCWEWAIDQKDEFPSRQPLSVLSSCVMSPASKRIIKWISRCSSLQSSRWVRWNDRVENEKTQNSHSDRLSMHFSETVSGQVINQMENGVLLDYSDFCRRLFSSRSESSISSEKSSKESPIDVIESLLERILFDPVEASSLNAETISILDRRVLADVLFAVCGIRNHSPASDVDHFFYVELGKSSKDILSHDTVAIKGLWINLYVLIVLLIREQQYLQSWHYLYFLTHNVLSASSSGSRLQFQLWIHALYLFSCQMNKISRMKSCKNEELSVREKGGVIRYWETLQLTLHPLSNSLNFSSVPLFANINAHNISLATKQKFLFQCALSFDRGIWIFQDAARRKSLSIENNCRKPSFNDLGIFTTIEITLSPCQQYLSLTRKTSNLNGIIVEFSIDDIRVGSEVLMEISNLRKLLSENKKQLFQGTIKSEYSSEETHEKVRWWASRISLEEDLHDLVDRFDEILRSGCSSKLVSSNLSVHNSPRVGELISVLLLGQVPDKVAARLRPLSSSISNKWMQVIEGNICVPEGYIKRFSVELQELTLLLLQGLPYLFNPFLKKPGGFTETMLEEEKHNIPNESRSVSRKGISLRRRFSLPPCLYFFESLECKKSETIRMLSENDVKGGFSNAKLIEGITKEFIIAFDSALSGLKCMSVSFGMERSEEEEMFATNAREFLRKKIKSVLYTNTRNKSTDAHDGLTDSLYKFVSECIGEALQCIAACSPRLSSKHVPAGLPCCDLVRLPRHHVFLILEPPLHEIPWEVSRALRLHSVSRVPSMEYIRRRLQHERQKRMVLNGDTYPTSSSFKFKQSLLDRSFIVFDRKATEVIPELQKVLPEEEAQETDCLPIRFELQEINSNDEYQNRGNIIHDIESIQRFLKNNQGRGSKSLWNYLRISSFKSSAQSHFRRNHSQNVGKPFSLYLYLGHKAGETLISKSELLDYFPPFLLSQSNAESPPVVLLMGCSSARFDVSPSIKTSSSAFLPPPPPEVVSLEGGYPYAYLHAGAPAFVGCLWDVTNGEIDGFVLNVIKSTKKYKVPQREYQCNEKLTSDEVSSNIKTESAITLGESVALARQKCKLPMLTGASTVFYGMNNIFVC